MRRVKCLEGTVEAVDDLRIRFDYGASPGGAPRGPGQPLQRDDCAHMQDSPSEPHPAGTAPTPRTRRTGRGERRRPRRTRRPVPERPEPQRGTCPPRARRGKPRRRPYRHFRERVRRAAHEARSGETDGKGLLAVAGPDALLLTGPQLEPAPAWPGRQGRGGGARRLHRPGADIRVLEGRPGPPRHVPHAGR
ncbi:hypothetical protein QJS66_14950 [Kocuria rhizophila]|nr:hypothetical protein QJS66_14950 [Kocuria rhizophila]